MARMATQVVGELGGRGHVWWRYVMPRVIGVITPLGGTMPPTARLPES